MASPEDIRLFRWIRENAGKARHNLSMSGFPEPVLHEMGINTSFEAMKRDAPNPESYFLDRLCNLYRYDRSNVMTTIGGSEAIFLLSLYAKFNGADVFTGLPEYEPIFTVPMNLKVKTHMAPFPEVEKQFGEHDSKKAFFFSNPNNPMGNLHRSSYLNSIHDHLKKDDFMYADEAFLEFTFRKKPESFFRDSQGIIVNGSLTKFYGFSGLRVGWIAASSEVIEKLKIIRNSTGIINPEYPLWIAGQSLDNRSLFMERGRRIMGKNLPALKKFVESHGNLSWEAPESASYAFIHYDYNIGSEDFCRQAMQNSSVLIGPGDYFGVPASFRLCFTQEPEAFARSLEALGNFLSSL
ncbi:MAG: aminotransferase class I/II-fold pyridoxal phosphate-dependent enzyme [Thermoplasmatales archaeon]|nr:aminotransferase class I/II-fold pyridoxal phosphate-dependent enzyme [Thermoplasmatales archaeon]